MTHVRLSFVCALLGACNQQQGEPTKPDPSEPGADPATLDDCEETDLEVFPWSGAMFDPATGELTGPLPDSYLVATTVGWPHDGEEHEQVLGDYSNRVIADLFTREGLLGAMLGTSEQCGSARTLSLWSDEASLVAFVTGDAHAEAIAVALPHTKAWETTHWTGTSADQVPDWEDARAKLVEVRQ